MDYSLAGSSVHGIFQARILEWVAISFSRGSSRPRDLTSISCIGRQVLYHWVTWVSPNTFWPSSLIDSFYSCKSGLTYLIGNFWKNDHLGLLSTALSFILLRASSPPCLNRWSSYLGMWGGKLKVLVAQACPTLCDPVDCSPPGSSVHEILQARILEWVVISYSQGSSTPRDRTQVSCTAGRFFTIWVTRGVFA